MILSDFQDSIYNIMSLVTFLILLKHIKSINLKESGIIELQRYFIVLLSIFFYELVDEVYNSPYKKQIFTSFYIILAYYFNEFFIVKNIDTTIRNIFKRVNFFLSIIALIVGLIIQTYQYDYINSVYVLIIIFSISIIIFGFFSENKYLNLAISLVLFIIVITLITGISGMFYLNLFVINLLIMSIILNRNNLLLKKDADDFEEKMEIQEKILKFIAHDLKAPLVSINGYNKSIKEQDIDGKFYEENNRIDENVESINNLLDRFINLSKIKTRPLEREWKNLDLSVRSLIFSNSNLFNDVEYQISYKLDNYEVYLDEFYFGRIIKNLLENAVKYRNENHRLDISIEISKNNSNYEFLFKDNGIGIESTEFSKIFESNYRVENKKDIEGLGYGLALIKFIIDKHGWSIKVDSKLNEFTSFILIIPAKDIRFEP